MGRDQVRKGRGPFCDPKNIKNILEFNITSPGIFSYRIAICDSKTWKCDSFLKSWCKTAIEVYVRYPKSSSEVLNVKYIFRYFPLYYHTMVKVS